MACWVFAVRHLAPEEAQLSTTYFPHGAACYQHFVATFAKQHPGRPSPRAPTPAPPLPVPLPGVRLPTTSSPLPASSYSVAATDLSSATHATPPPGAEDQLEGGHARDPETALACTTIKLGSVVEVTPDLEGNTGSEVGVGGVHGAGSHQGLWGRRTQRMWPQPCTWSSSTAALGLQGLLARLLSRAQRQQVHHTALLSLAIPSFLMRRCQLRSHIQLRRQVYMWCPPSH